MSTHPQTQPRELGERSRNVEVLRLNVTPPAFASSTTNFTSLYYAKGVAGTAFIKVNIPFTTGQIVGILGTRGTTTMNSSYGSSPTYSSTLNGKPITLTRLLLGVGERARGTPVGTPVGWTLQRLRFRTIP